MQRRQRQLLLISSSCIFVFSLGLVYFLFLHKENTNSTVPTLPESRSSPEWKALQEDSSVLDSEDYPSDLRGFLEEYANRTRVLWEGDHQKAYEELQKIYPGERGQVLFSLLTAFLAWKAEVASLEADPQLSSWEREERSLEFQKTRFSQNLRAKIFPPRPERAQLQMLWFLEDYSSKNPYSVPRERKRALLGFLRERYPEQRDFVHQGETPEARKKLFQLLHAKILETMSPEEMERFFEAHRKEWESLDFWN